MLLTNWSMELSPLIHPSEGLSWFVFAVTHVVEKDLINHQLSALRLQEQRWSKFKHLAKIPFKMICLSAVRVETLSASSTVVVLSSAFCFTGNWQCGIKLACLSSLNRTCFWSMFWVSGTRYISVSVQLCDPTVQKNKQLEKQTPYCWGVFYFQAAYHSAYISDTKEVKQTVETFTLWKAQRWLWLLQ